MSEVAKSLGLLRSVASSPTPTSECVCLPVSRIRVCHLRLKTEELWLNLLLCHVLLANEQAAFVAPATRIRGMIHRTNEHEDAN